MTESEWLACADPKQLLASIEGKASDRKLQLFAVACCDRIWGLLTDARSRSAVAALRRYADGRADDEEMTRETSAAQVAAGNAETSVWVSMVGFEAAKRATTAMGQLDAVVGFDLARAVEAAVGDDIATNAHRAAHIAVCCVWSKLPQHVPTSHHASWAATYAARAVAGGMNNREGWEMERSQQSLLLRDIFGNPFRPVAFDPAWRTETVIGIASAIYENRAFERLPILADALQEAGCENEDILSHCREPGEHVRGCWVVDLVLGKK